MQTQDYQIGDEFRLNEAKVKGRDKGPSLSKSHFRITRIHDDGIGITAEDINELPNSWAQTVYSMPKPSMEIHLQQGHIEWITRNGQPVAPVVKPDAEVKEFIAKTEAALEFLPVGAPIPYDIGTAGMLFDEDEVEAEVTLFA